MIKAGLEGNNFDYKTEGIQLPIKQLCLEATRRCNMKCAHCMRGAAQNHTMSKAVIDKTLDNVFAIDGLFLTGGEPFLEPDIIDYIFDGIIKRKIPIKRVGVVTNGSIRNSQIAESINRITDYICDSGFVKNDKKSLRMIGQITISNDDFHDPVDIPETLRFYRGYLNKHTIIKREIERDNHILMLGNALKNKEIFAGRDLRYHVCPYRVDLDGDAITTEIQIGWDGKVLIGEDSSYEQQDASNYGNILDEPLSCLLYKNAFNKIPFNKKEAVTYDYVYSKWMAGDENYEGAVIYLDLIRLIREKLKYVYPFLSWDEVAEHAYDEAQVYLHHVGGIDDDIYQVDTLQPMPRKTLAECEQGQKDLYFRGLREDPIGTIIRRACSISERVDDEIRSLKFKPTLKKLIRPISVSQV